MSTFHLSFFLGLLLFFLLRIYVLSDSANLVTLAGAADSPIFKLIIELGEMILTDTFWHSKFALPEVLEDVVEYDGAAIQLEMGQILREDAGQLRLLVPGEQISL